MDLKTGQQDKKNLKNSLDKDKTHDDDYSKIYKFAELKKIRYSLYTAAEVRKKSSVEILNGTPYDTNGVPLDGGVMDPKLGVISPNEKCKTCGGNFKTCYGHTGHIELNYPCINMPFIDYLKKNLNCYCDACGKFISISGQKSQGPLGNCPHCGHNRVRYSFVKPCMFYKIVERKEEKDGKTITMPIRVYNNEMRNVFEKIPLAQQKIGAAHGLPTTKDYRLCELFMTTLLVPPIRIRPTVYLDSGEKSMSDLTPKLMDIVRANNKIVSLIEKNVVTPFITRHKELLQWHVTTYINNKLPNVPLAKFRGGRVLVSVVERLSGKEGRLRGNLSGKRIDYAARTTITPRPDIELDQVAVPKIIAAKLSKIEIVTAKNIEKFRKMILNYPNYCTIHYIYDGDIKKKIIEQNAAILAESLQIGQKIRRNIVTGDYVLFNRQPTLHKQSIMAHRVIISDDETLGLNPAVCTPYNADFDGDEMNIHVLQNYMAECEASELMSVRKNLLNSKNGKPNIGAVRDILAGLYVLTDSQWSMRDTSKFMSETEPIKKLIGYHGCDILSAYIPGKIDLKIHTNSGEIIIENSVIKSRIPFGKAAMGSSGKLLEYIIKTCSEEQTMQFYRNMTKLGLNVVDHVGLTFGYTQCALPQKIKKLLKTKVEKISNSKDYEISDATKIKNSIHAILSSNIPELPKAVQYLIGSGAAGSVASLIPISVYIGQNTIRNKMVDMDEKNKINILSDNSAELRGFVASNYLRGLSPIEYWTQSMASREGTIDTYTKTSTSGYIARRLVNALENIHIDKYLFVVNAAGHIISLYYGQFGFDDVLAYDKMPIFKKYFEKSGKKIKISLKNKEHLKIIENEYLKNTLLEHLETYGISEKDDKNFKFIVEKIISEHQHCVHQPVGLVTAQSIAEPATQMTLRSVHSSGDSNLLISTGLEKLNEVVDHTKMIKQKITKIQIKAGVDSGTIDRICQLFDVVKGPQLDIKISIEDCKLTIDEHPQIEKIFEVISTKPVVRRYSTMKLENSKIQLVINQDMGYTQLSKLYSYLQKTTMLGPSKVDGYSTIKNSDGSTTLILKGINFKYLQQKLPLYIRYISQIECNSSYEIEKYYGIPYSSANIVMELDRTLNKQQGLDVSYTHLKLVAQAMTFTTCAKQIGRHGIVSDKTAILSQAAYETALKVMVKAAANKSTDLLNSVFSSIIVGRMPPHIGTGRISIDYQNDN